MTATIAAAATERHAAEPRTLVELLEARALHQPDRTAYTFLADGDRTELHVTYAQLDAQARAVAAWLQALGAEHERVLMLYPPGLEFVAGFFGCLYAGAVAVPAYPPNVARPERTMPRIRAIAADARPAVVMTTAAIAERSEALAGHAPELGAARWLASDLVPLESAAGWRQPAIDGGTLAFLQYTSGSTMAPKGVMVSHANLLSNSANLDTGWDHDADSVLVSWLPHFHDMGLIYGIIQPLYRGFRSVLMMPAAFTQQPSRWLEAISRFRATHSAAPNFAYDLCARKVTPEQRATLDLRSWRVALNGAEPVRAETLRRFTDAFEGCGFDWNAFCPGYGLAEATLKVSAATWLEPPLICTVDAAALERHRVVEAPEGPSSTTLVGSGRPALDTTVVIVEPQTRERCAADEIGEIWAAGSSIAQGYWGRDEETERTFGAFLRDGDGPFLRTGDLGFVRDGHVFVTGRLKDLIIINGRNHYPQDIEQAVERCHPALRPSCCAAFSATIDGEERLIVVAEVERSQRRAPGAASLAAELPKAIRRAVAEHYDVRVHDIRLLRVNGLPKTSSGKVQRSACRTGFLDGTLTLWSEA